MRIAQVSTVATPVRGRQSGSVEATVWLMARELTRRGHEVTVFGTAESDADAEVVETLPGPYARNGSPSDWQLCEWINLCRAVERSSEFDVMHAHAYLWSLPLTALADCPMVHTTHVLPYEDAADLWSLYPDACVSAISEHQWSAYPHLRPAAVIPHGIDAARHAFVPEPDDYLCYLGRFIPGKGPLEAIAAARELGLRLVMAGPQNDYYREQVAPHVDGSSVEFLGFIEPERRDELLGGARALLYPVRAAEPFGLVMVEAMMSGTPVAAFGVGAVSEIVEEGRTGAVEAPGGSLTAAIGRCLELDRAAVRAEAERRFSAARMVAHYESLYTDVAGVAA